MQINLKTERRWAVRKLIIAVNLLLIGFAFYADYIAMDGKLFVSAMNGFQGASAVWFAADYATKPKE